MDFFDEVADDLAGFADILSFGDSEILTGRLVG